jgi:hypothetical protein
MVDDSLSADDMHRRDFFDISLFLIILAISGPLDYFSIARFCAAITCYYRLIAFA